eukprot:457904-Pyramimonas_sp.AAC.1
MGSSGHVDVDVKHGVPDGASAKHLHITQGGVRGVRGGHYYYAYRSISRLANTVNEDFQLYDITVGTM